MAARPKKEEIPYQDLPDVPEQFADHLQRITVRGHVATLTFAVTRLEEAPPQKSPRMIRYTSVRLVIPTEEFMELYNKVTSIMTMLEAQGVLKREGQQRGPTTVQ